jgi:hypothetical protein
MCEMLGDVFDVYDITAGGNIMVIYGCFLQLWEKCRLCRKF